MLRKKKDTNDVQIKNASTRSGRKSLVEARGHIRPSPSPTPKRKTSSNEKRKTSRIHLGRINYSVDSNEEEPEPTGPISQYDFFTAACCGKMKAITKFLDDGGDVNTVDSCNRTALHRAALYEQTQAAELLIRRGAKVNRCDKLNNIPLHWACRGTSFDMVQLLLNNRAKVNFKDKLLNTPLHVATRVGFTACVDYLLECGAKINEPDSEGDTAIHDAVRLGRHKVVRTLILHGADMFLKNKDGKTPTDLIQSWYNNVKDAVKQAELERKRKELNAQKLADEMRESSRFGEKLAVNEERRSEKSSEGMLTHGKMEEPTVIADKMENFQEDGVIFFKGGSNTN
ncbi:uncharacterized protein LOC143459859 [Clavelina lepadiformis]|uniref:uncharacterized protein LOC143459859 n=1 Tax=Clavelina lepadiformis TaxID=159417 RepID=UPI0040412158